jgi:amino acid transporter
MDKQDLRQKRKHMRATGIKYGLIAAASMIIYFIIMRIVGLVHFVELRFLNYLIVAVCMYKALHTLGSIKHPERLPYFKGMGVEYWVAIVSAVVFGIFLFIYSSIDHAFVKMMEPRLPYDGKLTPAMIAFEVFSEIIIISIVLNLMVLMIFKRNRDKPTHDHNVGESTSKTDVRK